MNWAALLRRSAEYARRSVEEIASALSAPGAPKRHVSVEPSYSRPQNHSGPKFRPSSNRQIGARHYSTHRTRFIASQIGLRSSRNLLQDYITRRTELLQRYRSSALNFSANTKSQASLSQLARQALLRHRLKSLKGTQSRQRQGLGWRYRSNPHFYRFHRSLHFRKFKAILSQKFDHGIKWLGQARLTVSEMYRTLPTQLPTTSLFYTQADRWAVADDHYSTHRTRFITSQIGLRSSRNLLHDYTIRRTELLQRYRFSALNFSAKSQASLSQLARQALPKHRLKSLKGTQSRPRQGLGWRYRSNPHFYRLHRSLHFRKFKAILSKKFDHGIKWLGQARLTVSEMYRTLRAQLPTISLFYTQPDRWAVFDELRYSGNLPSLHQRTFFRVSDVLKPSELIQMSTDVSLPLQRYLYDQEPVLLQRDIRKELGKNSAFQSVTQHENRFQEHQEQGELTQPDVTLSQYAAQKPTAQSSAIELHDTCGEFEPTDQTFSAAVDFDLAPRIALPIVGELNDHTVSTLRDIIASQINHLQSVMSDISRVAELGELPISMEGHGSTLRVHFPNSDLDRAATLLDDKDVTKGTVHEIISPAVGSVPDSIELLALDSNNSVASEGSIDELWYQVNHSSPALTMGASTYSSSEPSLVTLD